MGERRIATPADVVAEIVAGVLRGSPRPRPLHASVSSVLGEELGPPFRRGRGGPGGWLILDEPELHLAADVLVPDLAGWRRERLPVVPDQPALSLAPDWVCEVLSPSTAVFDRRDKLPVYARERVTQVWFIDPAARLLEVLRLDGTSYRIAGAFAGDDGVRAEPFDAIELPLGALWNA
jgi:Uma2 family endonuclease